MCERPHPYVRPAASRNPRHSHLFFWLEAGQGPLYTRQSVHPPAMTSRPSLIPRPSTAPMGPVENLIRTRQGQSWVKQSGESGAGSAQVQASPSRRPTSKREEGKGACSLVRAGLSSYLYRLCVTYVHSSMLGVVSTTPLWKKSVRTVEEEYRSVANKPRFGYYSPARTGSAGQISDGKVARWRGR